MFNENWIVSPSASAVACNSDVTLTSQELNTTQTILGAVSILGWVLLRHTSSCEETAYSHSTHPSHYLSVYAKVAPHTLTTSAYMHTPYPKTPANWPDRPAADIIHLPAREEGPLCRLSSPFFQQAVSWYYLLASLAQSSRHKCFPLQSVFSQLICAPILPRTEPFAWILGHLPTPSLLNFHSIEEGCHSGSPTSWCLLFLLCENIFDVAISISFEDFSVVKFLLSKFPSCMKFLVWIIENRMQNCSGQYDWSRRNKLIISCDIRPKMRRNWHR